MLAISADANKNTISNKLPLIFMMERIRYFVLIPANAIIMHPAASAETSISERYFSFFVLPKTLCKHLQGRV